MIKTKINNYTYIIFEPFSRKNYGLDGFKTG